ncbi:hypothetical protein L0P88_14160 [Muricauda sp. SCSIO 64092]|uniref:hypothetical protein n=1 Tax=Allomuricauda sp. SCSIO 64092 TaxID=2908842 RepID=UPI001FF4BCF4|nr:hypothetical protein [Muricauda sp. SCSIO 64092]UOY05095.1 hypothetical protein L0P88_14160 [Muricauda sp. SCSIO 64092]
MTNAHSFHIPVMGIGFTVDTPLKVSCFGIDSVISLVDDILLEKLRKMYCEKFEVPYHEITEKMEDFRAKRITSYLDLIQDLAQKKFEEFKNTTVETANGIKEYFNMLPNSSELKQEFIKMTQDYFNLDEVGNWVKEHMPMGSIDVNIMTKVDKENYIKKERLPSQFNDAHAALRGYAKSSLHSSVILSAGMNPRLYSYLEEFEDFHPDENGHIKKKIVLKVSDYRSALIQGKFLAKKGIWVSEYRIESGLNCGGHAFATDGYLLGPILNQFKENRDSLIQSVYDILVSALENKNHVVPKAPPTLKITAQGGVGTEEEHAFLLEHYNVDSVGWGTPFLLVPEATTVDDSTMARLIEAKEDDLYLSDISPLGIPFHSLKGNTKDEEKFALMDKGRPGSPCPKKFVALNKEMTDLGICVASRLYQHLKIKELDNLKLPQEQYQLEYWKIVEKSCICVGLGTSALLAHGLDTTTEGPGVSICPGPNMAYFSKVMVLKELIDHIYGRINVINRDDRPNMFIKELHIYIDFLQKKIDEAKEAITDKQKKNLSTFANNLKDGITYYRTVFNEVKGNFEATRTQIISDLDSSINTLHVLGAQIEEL